MNEYIVRQGMRRASGCTLKVILIRKEVRFPLSISVDEANILTAGLYFSIKIFCQCSKRHSFDWMLHSKSILLLDPPPKTSAQLSKWKESQRSQREANTAEIQALL